MSQLHRRLRVVCLSGWRCNAATAAALFVEMPGFHLSVCSGALFSTLVVELALSSVSLVVIDFAVFELR